MHVQLLKEHGGKLLVIEHIHYLFVFILVWWVLFFILLPFGIVVPQKQENEIFASSAPEKTKMTLKLFVTTLLSLVCMVCYHIIICG